MSARTSKHVGAVAAVARPEFIQYQLFVEKTLTSEPVGHVVEAQQPVFPDLLSLYVG